MEGGRCNYRKEGREGGREGGRDREIQRETERKRRERKERLFCYTYICLTLNKPDVQMAIQVLERVCEFLVRFFVGFHDHCLEIHWKTVSEVVGIIDTVGLVIYIHVRTEKQTA